MGMTSCILPIQDSMEVLPPTSEEFHLYEDYGEDLVVPLSLFKLNIENCAGEIWTHRNNYGDLPYYARVDSDEGLLVINVQEQP